MRWPGKWRTLTLKLWRETRGPDIEQNGWQPPQRWSEQKAVKTTTTEQKMFHTALENAREAAAPFCVDFSFCVRLILARGRDGFGESFSVWCFYLLVLLVLLIAPLLLREWQYAVLVLHTASFRELEDLSRLFFLLLAKRCYSHPSAPEEKFTLNKLGPRFCLKI